MAWEVTWVAERAAARARRVDFMVAIRSLGIGLGDGRGGGGLGSGGGRSIILVLLK